MGDKKRPFYRVVVADSRSPRDGKFIEVLGTYDPLKNPAEIKIDTEKTKKWLANGAQPTDTAKSILITAGAIPVPKKRPPAKTYKKAEEPVVEAKPEVKPEPKVEAPPVVEEKVEAPVEEVAEVPAVEEAKAEEVVAEPVAEPVAEEAPAEPVAEASAEEVVAEAVAETPAEEAKAEEPTTETTEEKTEG